MKRRRLYALAAIAAVAVAVLAVAPALGQEEEPPAIAFVATSSVTPRFQTAGQSDQVLATASNGCQLVGQPGTLMALSAGPASGSGGNYQPGLQGLSLGVKSPGSNANGTPCSQVDRTERLVLTPGTAMAGKEFVGLRLDLEMTKDAIVVLTLDDNTPFKLYTGNNFTALCNSNAAVSGCPGDPSNGDDPATVPYEVSSGPGELLNGCAAVNSSGPNSGASDNCIWTVDPGYEFGQITIRVENAGGTVSLEGGFDTGLPSLFYLAENRAPVANDQSVYVDYVEDANGDPTSSQFTLDVSDPDGDSLSFTFPSTTTEGGTLSRNGLTVTYTPPKGFIGSDSFSYSVSDGEESDSATVTIYEIFECGETLTVPENGMGVSGEYERLIVPGGCDVGKPYEVAVYEFELGEDGSAPAILFQPRPRSGPAVEDCSLTPDDCEDEFRAVVTFAPRGEANAPDTGTLRYDPVAQDDPEQVVFRDMQWCEFDPFAAGVDPEDRRTALPAGESWCIAEVRVTIAGEGETATSWITFGIGDPWKIAT